MSKLIVPHAHGAASAGEDNDCSVRALSNATGMSYQEAHETLKKAGRQDRKSCLNQIWEKVYLDAGLKLEAIFGTTKSALRKKSHNPTTSHYKGIGIGNLIPQLNPRKTYVIQVKDHVFCVKNGKVLDSHPQPAGTRVVSLYSM